VRARAFFWPTQQQQLVLRAALLGGNDSVEAWQMLRPTFDLDRVEPTLYALLPLVHRQLDREGVADPLMPRLRGIYRRTWYGNQLLLGRLADPLQAVEESGADPIVVSTWELPALHYRDFGLRRVDALRVLVRPERLEAAARALADSGWEEPPRAPKSRPQAGHGAQFHKNGDQCFLQWRLSHEFTDPARGLEPVDVWAAAVELPLGGATARALGPADELLNVCLSGARRSNWPSVVWIADAISVLRSADSQVDWNRVVRQATRLRATLRLHEALRLLREELDAPIPDAVLEELDGVEVLHRERVAFRADCARWRLLGGPPESLTRFLRVTAHRPLGAALAELPGFLRDEWGLERRSQVPVSAARKSLSRAARLTGRRRRREERPTVAK
jgi:Uncharacterised nucleotidyltransferase